MTDAKPFYSQLRDVDEVQALADARLEIALVVSRFNEPIVNRLVEGAAATLVARGADLNNIELIRVPGAFELPAAVRLAVESDMFDAVIALGCVIRGETPHFDYISTACANNLANLARKAGIPVTFGVLTTDTREQAMQRSVLLDDWAQPDIGPSRAQSNKGADAAVAALEMLDVFREWEGDDDED